MKADALTLSIAGLPVRLLLPPALMRMAKRRYQGFVSGTPPVLTLAVSAHGLPAGPRVVAPVVTRSGRGITILRHDMEARIEGRTGAAKVLANAYSLDSFLRILYTILLLPAQGFLLHGAGLARGRKGWLFAGVSGSGKTTVTRLSRRQARVLSDELTAVRLVKGRWRVFATPFFGEFKGKGKDFRADLAGTGFLVKAGDYRLIFKTPPEAVRSLLRCVMFFSHRPGDVRRLLGLLQGLAAAVPVYDLHFPKRTGFWKEFRGMGLN